MIDKIISYRSWFYQRQDMSEGLEFFKACKDKSGLNKVLSSTETEAFRDMVLVYGLKYPDHLDAIKGFVEFSNRVNAASKIK